MTGFELTTETIDLPPGAFARAHRRWLRCNGRALLALTDGAFRPYLYPVLSPSGHLVTSESPADHPHHHSMWIGADHVHIDVPVAAGGFETYAYNFYLNETFQGRAPGRIVERAVSTSALSADRFVVEQQLAWIGPAEWGAPEGRAIATERRTWTISVAIGAYCIAVRSEIGATEWALTLGPTRHAYFNVRIAETMQVANGGRITRDTAGAEPSWVDFSGPVGGGAFAGITVIAGPADHGAHTWFVTDWGVVTVGSFRTRPARVGIGRSLVSDYAAIVHDGPFDPAHLGKFGGPSGS